MTEKKIGQVTTGQPKKAGRGESSSDHPGNKGQRVNKGTGHNRVQ